MTEPVSQADIERYLRLAMDAAETTAQAGNHPYGAVIVSPDGEIIATAANAIHANPRSADRPIGGNDTGGQSGHP